mgnify:FL=1
MQTNFEVISPQGAGGHFLRYWGSVGLEQYEKNDVQEVGYQVIKHWENNPIIPKDSKEKEQVYRAETNEYISRVKNITMKHPWQFIFNEKDPEFDGKRIFIKCSEKETEKFCYCLYKEIQMALI